MKVYGKKRRRKEENDFPFLRISEFFKSIILLVKKHLKIITSDNKKYKNCIRS